MKVMFQKLKKKKLTVVIETKKYHRIKVYEKHRKLIDKKIYKKKYKYLKTEIEVQEINVNQFDLENIAKEIDLLREVVKYLKELKEVNELDTEQFFEKLLKPAPKKKWYKRGNNLIYLLCCLIVAKPLIITLIIGIILNLSK